MKYLTLLLLALGLWSSDSSASVVITNGLTHSFDMVSGNSQKGYIMLQNVSKKPQRVVVYKNDLSVGCEGDGLAIEEPASTERSNVSWIELSMEERTLAPGEKYSLTYEVQAPAKNLTGSYWGLLMVEVKKPIDTLSSRKGVSISSNIRYAVQIITNFTSSKTTDVQFADVGYAEETQSRKLNIRLFNNSERLVSPDVKIEVYDDNGEIIYYKKADSKKLYPEQCRNFIVPIEDIPSGKYQAVIVADCGESDLFGMTLNLEVDE